MGTTWDGKVMKENVRAPAIKAKPLKPTHICLNRALSDVRTELPGMAAVSEPRQSRARSREPLVEPAFTGGRPVQLQAGRNQPEQTFSDKRGPGRNCAALELQVDEAAETAPLATYTRVASLIMLRKLRAHARTQAAREKEREREGGRSETEPPCSVAFGQIMCSPGRGPCSGVGVRVRVGAAATAAA